MIKRLIKLFIFLVFLGITSLIGLYVYAYFSRPIEIKSNNKYILYDNLDEMIFQGNNKQEWVTLDEISPNLQNAMISVEDKHFYHHFGFDLPRIFKTLVTNIMSKKIVGGASSISQQLVKNMYLTFDKTLERKIKEAFLTINLEVHYSKDEILNTYLNTVNFGGGAFGIENASKYYFNKSAKDLTLNESAVLAGIPKNPTKNNPITNYENAIKRRNIVLESMYNNKYITLEELEKTKNEEITLNITENTEVMTNYMYYQDAVINELESLKNIPKSVIESGSLKIYTTLDSNSENNMINAINTEMKDSGMQVASILVDPNTGGVLALSGGKNYNESQYNRVLSAKRQVGSTMKPLLYYTALENGLVSSSTFLSEYTTFNFGNNQTYSPKNFNDKYANKEITMAAALSYSDNIYAVKTHLFLGEDTLVKYGKKIGINTPLQEIPSLPLGTIELNMMEFATAYTTLASGGYKKDLYFIRRIEDYNGNIIYEHKDKLELVNNPNNTFILNELLTSTYDSNFKDYNNPTVLGLASKIQNKYAIKTGTTDTDFWLVGYNKNALMLVWNGYDDAAVIDNKDYNISRNIWLNTIDPYLSNKEDNWYSIPKNVIGIQKDSITGSEEFQNNHSYIYYYVKGTQ